SLSRSPGVRGPLGRCALSAPWNPRPPSPGSSSAPSASAGLGMPASNGLTARAVITTARVLFIFLLALLGNRSRYKEGPRAAPRRGRRAPSAAERDHVIVVPVQLLAAGQAPRPAHHQAAGTADQDPGRARPAVDAKRDGARQQAGDDRHARVAPAALAAARRLAAHIADTVTASTEAG